MVSEKEVSLRLEQGPEAAIESQEHDSSDISFAKWTEADEKRIRSRMDWRIVPTVFVLYLMCFIDRANIG